MFKADTVNGGLDKIQGDLGVSEQGLDDGERDHIICDQGQDYAGLAMVQGDLKRFSDLEKIETEVFYIFF